MATSDEQLEQLERSLQQARSALFAANYKIATLVSAAGTATAPTATTPSASMVDMRVLGKPFELCCRRSVVEELELRHVVLLCGSLARAACFDGEGQDDGPSRCGADSSTICSA